MTGDRGNSVVVDVHIDVPGDTSSEGISEEFRSLIERYLDDMLGDLELPGRVELTMGIDVLMPRDTIRIDTEAGRLRVAPSGAVHVGATDWSSEQFSIPAVVCGVLYGRELLLVPALIDAVWRSIENGHRVRDPDQRSWLVHEFVRYGYKMSWLSGGLSKSRARLHRQSDLETLFEGCIADWPGTMGAYYSASIAEQPRLQRGNLYEEPDGSPSIDKFIDHMLDQVFSATGVHAGASKHAIDSDGDWISLRINDLRLPLLPSLAANEYVIGASIDELADNGISAVEAVHPYTGAPCGKVDNEEAALEAARHGHLVVDGAQLVGLYVHGVISNNLGAFITAGKWRFMSLQLGHFVSPALVQLVQDRREETFVARVLRYLVDEQIAIRDMRSILHTISMSGDRSSIDPSEYIVFKLAGPGTITTEEPTDGREMSVAAVAEHCRNSLKRYITHQSTRGTNKVQCYLIDPALEEILTEPRFAAPYDSDARDFQRRFLDGVRDCIGYLDHGEQAPVVLVGMSSRRNIRELIRLEYPQLKVLSYQELSPDLDIDPLARITMSGDGFTIQRARQ